MSAHLGRDKTLMALADAGIWWQHMYSDVQDVIRTCLTCWSEKGQPLIMGHQRSREYDGLFRYLIVDFV